MANHKTATICQKQIEKMYYSEGSTVSEIAYEFKMPLHSVNQTLAIIRERRKAEKVSPYDEMQYLEESLWKAIETEKMFPSEHNKKITDNLQALYCKKIML